MVKGKDFQRHHQRHCLCKGTTKAKAENFAFAKATCLCL